MWITFCIAKEKSQYKRAVYLLPEQTDKINTIGHSLGNNMKKRRVPGLFAHVNGSIDLINCLGTRDLFLSKDRV